MLYPADSKLLGQKLRDLCSEAADMWSEPGSSKATASTYAIAHPRARATASAQRARR